MDAYPARVGAERTQRDEITRRRRIGLDMHRARRTQGAARCNRKALPALVAHIHTKLGEQLEGDVDIGLAGQLTHHLNHDSLARHQRQGHEQRGQELAGHIAANLDGCIELQFRAADAQGREPFGTQVAHVTAELAKCVYQIANRALVHARHATQRAIGTQHCQGGGQGAHGGPGIAQEKIQMLLRNAATQAGDMQHSVGAAQAATQAAQGIEHDPGVIGVQQVSHRGLALTHCAQQQHAVGNAFGAGQGDVTGSAQQVRNIQKCGAKHQKKKGVAGVFSRPFSRRHGRCWLG